MARQRQHQSRRESRDAREQHVCVCRACGNRHVARGARASSDVAREFRALFEEPARKSEWVSWRVLARFELHFRGDANYNVNSELDPNARPARQEAARAGRSV